MIKASKPAISPDICSPANLHQRHLDAWPQMQATSLIQGEAVFFVWFCQLGWYSWWLLKHLKGMGCAHLEVCIKKKTWLMQACPDMRANNITTMWTTWSYEAGHSFSFASIYNYPFMLKRAQWGGKLWGGKVAASTFEKGMKLRASSESCSWR